MDNNNYTQQPQQVYQQAPQQMQYTQQPQQMYQQAQYTQQMQYTQQPQQQMYQQAYGQTQYGQQQMYQQPGYGYAPAKSNTNIAKGIKDVKNEFTGRVSKMGVSVFGLLGIVAAMLFIFGPFMNFASIHFSQKIRSEYMDLGYGYYDYDDYYDDDDFWGGSSGKKSGSSKIKISAADGLNLFELSRLSGTVSRVAKKVGISKSDLADELDAVEPYVYREMDEVEYEIGMKIPSSSVKEAFGTVHLALKGRLALLLTPYIIILSGIGLFIFSIINKKIAKIVCAAIPLACIIWLMICSTHFFSLMGIGAWAIVIGCVGGAVSAFADKPAYN